MRFDGIVTYSVTSIYTKLFSKQELIVLGYFCLYPAIYTLLLLTPIRNEAALIFPGITTMVLVLIFGLFAMSFDFISGYTGYLSFGHAAFFGLGAYITILISNNKLVFLSSELPFILMMMISGVISSIAAILFGALSYRLKGIYFAIITLAFSHILYIIARSWNYLGSTPERGIIARVRESGFSIGVPYLDSFNWEIGRLTGATIEPGLGVELSSVETSYYLIGLVVLVCYLSMRTILRSPFGKVMIAIRENEERLQSTGINTYWYKLASFSISAFFAGIAGALFAGYYGSAYPEQTFYFMVTGIALVVTIIGGIGTLVGAFYGQLIYLTVNETLSDQEQGLLPYLRGHLPDGLLEQTIIGSQTIDNILESVILGQAELYIGIVFILIVLYYSKGIYESTQAYLEDWYSRMVTTTSKIKDNLLK